MTNKKIPMRKCVGCNEMKPKKELVRVMKDGEGNISLDFTGRKNGRGAYVCKSAECLQLARKRGGLERSFSMKIPPEVYEELQKEMANIESQETG